MRSDEQLEKEVAAVGDLSRDDLVRLWTRAYGCAPPKGIRRDLMIKSAVWHLQAKRLGGLPTETRRLLKAAIVEVERKLQLKGVSSGKVLEVGKACDLKTHRQQLTPGARLIRDWNGQSHIVDVIESGFVFEAKVYSSLSAIARRITGTRWSGPRFFGL